MNTLDERFYLRAAESGKFLLASVGARHKELLYTSDRKCAKAFLTRSSAQTECDELDESGRVLEVVSSSELMAEAAV